jgi:Fe-S-cluster-containing dehydrogenase component
MTLGDVELVVGTEGWEVSAQSVEYSELVKLPEAGLRRVLARQPEAEQLLWKSAVNRIRESGYSRANIDRAEFTEFALGSGLVQGTSVLVIDLETCTRCDDCVRACASTHGGRPRFVREGDKYSNLLIAHACYHCRDPVCLVGCPTGAIRRTGIGDVVAINDDICIGCGKCSKQCPYDNIVMHETGEIWPDDTPLAEAGEPRLVATKCDLCQSTGHDPACVSNCPQGCATRVTSLDAFEALLKRTD